MQVFSEKLPISYQLAELLRSRILSGDYPAGFRIPPETQLANDYGVSVVTVQRALRPLEQDGLISRHRGRGTYVLELPKRFSRPQVPSAFEMMFTDDFGTDAEVLAKEIVATPLRLREHFESVDKLFMTHRLLRWGGHPWNYSIHHMLPEIGRRINDTQLLRYPMFRIFREHLGLPPTRVDVNIQALSASAELSRHLEIDPTKPVLYFFGALFGADDKLLDITEIYFRGDRSTFRFEKSFPNE